MLSDLLTSLDRIRDGALDEIQGASSLKDIEDLRVKYLGKKSDLNAAMRGMGALSADEKPLLGQRANETKEALSNAIAARKDALSGDEKQARVAGETIDVTLPGDHARRGRLHPLTRVTEEVERVFISMGFTVEEGPDIEDDYHNFEALNIPKDHPARDMHDTFYLANDRLLRTHTSPVQIRTMQRHKPPLAVIAPGRVYRVDADQTHSPVFHQVEGFLVDTHVSFGDLKGVLHHFLREMFGQDVELRFRPSFFPFTEPSAEVDMKWTVTREIDGARVEVDEWLEILGAGMIHPAVMESVGYDPSKYTGFAFGAGIERLTMLKYGIKDIRLFYENDVRFLEQF
jgi:phenylalanyl-tRNA synthetase alpha chain